MHLVTLSDAGINLLALPTSSCHQLPTIRSLENPVLSLDSFSSRSTKSTLSTVDQNENETVRRHSSRLSRHLCCRNHGRGGHCELLRWCLLRASDESARKPMSCWKLRLRLRRRIQLHGTIPDPSLEPEPGCLPWKSTYGYVPPCSENPIRSRGIPQRQ